MKQIITIILFCLFSVPSFGAFGAGTVWRTSVALPGVDTNGGAFDSGVGSPGTDESQIAGVAITVTLATATTGTCSPACSSTTHGPGNFIHIASGTGCTTGAWYEILSQAAGTITVDHSMGSSTNVCVGTIGGPTLTIGVPISLLVAGNYVCVKADGTYNLSAGITASTNGNNASQITIQGYTSTCGIGSSFGDGGQATIKANSGTGYNMLQVAASHWSVYNLIFDQNGAGSVAALVLTQASNYAFNILIKNGGVSSNSIFVNNGPEILTNIRVTGGRSGCSSGVDISNGSAFLFSVVVDTSLCVGFTNTAGSLFCVFCIAANNTGASTDGFRWTSSPAQMSCLGCAAYGNGRDGFSFTQAVGNNIILKNNWSWGNGGKAFKIDTAVNNTQIIFDYNAYAAASLSGFSAGQHDVTLTGDPTVNGASLNFSLNNTTGAGAVIKGTAFPNGAFFSSTAYTSFGPIVPLVNSTANLGGASAFVQ